MSDKSRRASGAVTDTVTDAASGAVSRLASLGGVGRALGAVRRLVRREGWRGAVRKIVREFTGHARYQQWVAEFDTPTTEELARLQNQVLALSRKPLMSIVVPVYNTPAPFLAGMIQSILDQVYPHWELCIADDASSEPHIKAMLRDYAEQDARIRVVLREQNGHICEASNSALELATGEYIALLDHDDLLPRHALAMVVKYINAHPEGRLFYSDEDKISTDGKRSSPYFKSDWDPELIVQQNFFSHFGVFETQVVREIGGFRKGFEGSQDWDLVLRSVRVTGDAAVIHIPHVLYHWRTIAGSTAVSAEEKPYAVRASMAAIAGYLAAQQIDAEVVPPSTACPFVQVDYAMPASKPGVHVIVRSNSDVREAQACVENLVARTRYGDYGLSVVVSGTAEDADRLKSALAANMRRLAVSHTSDATEAARIVNEMAARQKEAYVCLLDANTQIPDEHWLEILVSHAARSTSGLVGPMLRRPDGSVYAAGLVATSTGSAVRSDAGTGARDIGYFGRAVSTHTASALPCVCVVVRRDLLLRVGGIQADADSAFGADVDLSFRIASTGVRNVVVPRLSVVFTGKTDREDAAEAGSEHNAAAAAHSVAFRDRGYSPNLSLQAATARFDLAFPPRVERFG